MPDILAEAVHSGEACGASTSEMMNDHLPGEQAENVFEDVAESGRQVQASSLPHPAITISDRILSSDQSLSSVKTTISDPDQLKADEEKYKQGSVNNGCDCQTCKARIAALQQQQQQPQSSPIMVTPYRHNWLISGAHKDEADDLFDFRNCCQIQ